MKITPNRTMRLQGKRVEAGKPVDVSNEAGQLAIRHGWAEAVAPKPAKSKSSEKAGDKTDDSQDGDQE